MNRWTLLRGAALAALLIAASPARAQEPLGSDPMEQARAAETRRDPAEALSRYLRALAANPRRFDALMGAGRSALAIGDANAALSFYARAEEIEPRNGAVKAGLGSALVQLEQPRPALRMFDDAISLGISPALVASDRGLAYDLRGDNDRAQREYLLALRDRDDAETVRRLALSQAIGGNREAALRTLDPLLRRQDIAAWRARSFILALTGDTPAAQTAATQVMPRPQAIALAPFLERLPGLKPAQKAAAVHFGHFPSTGRSYSQAELFADAASADRPLAPGADRALVPQGQPLGRGPGDDAIEAPVSKSPRRRPGSADGMPATKPPPGTLRLDVLPPARPQTDKPAPAKATATPLPQPSSTASASSPPSRRLAIEPGFDIMGDTTATARAAKPKPVTLAQANPPPTSKPAANMKAEPPKAEAAKPKAGPTKPESEKSDARNLELKKPEPKKAEAEKSGAQQKSAKANGKADAKDYPKAKTAAEADAKARKDGKDKKADTKEAKNRPAERYWVQVAGGKNKADLPRAFAQLKAKWPKQLSGRSAYTTPLRATNRLLIGPYKSADEAQSWVNEANKSGFASFPYTSPAGVEVEKLAAK